jgi:hypothetical protein
VAVVELGKNAAEVRRAVEAVGARVEVDDREAEVAVIGALSPGPMIDGWRRRAHRPQPVVMPWRPRGLVPGRAPARDTLVVAAG